MPKAESAIRGVLCSAVAVGLLAGCAPTAPRPGASVTTIVAPAGVFITFAGERYTAFGAQSTPSNPPDGTLLVIPLEDIASIGLATEADPVQFPDRTVYQIRNVDPSDAVVMFDRSADVPEMLAFTRDGKSPTVVPGLCDYYVDPTLQLCHPGESSAP